MPLELISFSRLAIHDMVNRYANDRMAQKYKNAVTNVSTVLSVGPNVCIFSMEVGFSENNCFRTVYLPVFSKVGIAG